MQGKESSSFMAGELSRFSLEGAVSHSLPSQMGA